MELSNKNKSGFNEKNQPYEIEGKLPVIEQSDGLVKRIKELDEKTERLFGNQFDLHRRINNIETRNMQRGRDVDNVIRKETLECVIDKIDEDCAFVIILVNDHKEERMMSADLLLRAGVVREDQPFQIEVTEIITPEGLESRRLIKPVGDPSKWRLEQVRPDLDLDKFKKKQGRVDA